MHTSPTITTKELTHFNNIRTLNQMQKDGTIIIKKADKSNKLIIMDKETYTTKALQQLNDTTNYSTITNKTTDTINKEVIDNFDFIKRTITRSKLTTEAKQQLIKYVRPYALQTRFPRIYFNPKTHKPDNPLRPIVSGINWATENAAILLDETLKPLINSNKHIPKDTFQFLKIIEDQQFDLLTLNHNNTFIVTFDIVSLYTAIPQDTAATRITNFLSTNRSTIPATIFNQLTNYILTNNYFTFQDTIYKQEHGIAMGNPAGGAIDNTYMLDWDKIIMNPPIHKKHLQTYLRYFVDGFIIWNGTEAQLISFLSFINSIDKHIKTTSVNGKSAVYLDTNISIDPHNTIRTRTNRKSTSTESYLDYTSAHPKLLKDNLPMSILFRAFITCNTQ